MKKVSYDNLPEAIAELLERVKQIEELLTKKATIAKNKKINVSKFAEQKKLNKKDKDMLTVQEASKLLNISVISLYSYVKNRKIPFKKENRRLYFFKPELENWNKDRGNNTQQKSNDTITVKEAEKLFSVPSPTLYYYIKSRKIPFIAKKGNKLYFSKQAISDVINKEGKKNKRKIKGSVKKLI